MIKKNVFYVALVSSLKYFSFVIAWLKFVLKSSKFEKIQLQ